MSKPNILIVLIDGCRADRLGCYGYDNRPTSPNLDKFAQQGFVALNNYSTSNCTIPATTSMMTGLYPSVHKAASGHSYYDGKYPYLTDILQDEGYYTFGLMNNLIGYSPEWGVVRGYDRFYRMGKHSQWFKESKEEQRGVKKKIPLDLIIKKNILKGINTICAPLASGIERRSQLRYYFNNDMGGRKAVEVLGQALGERDKAKPFFGYINLPDTHPPYFVPNQHYSPSQRVMSAILKPLEFSQRGYKLTESDKETISYMYDTCVQYSDNLCGQIVQLLEDMKLSNNTIVIFTSDHGGMLAEKFNWVGGKYHLFEPEAKTVLIMKGPGVSGVKKQLSSAVDVFSTVLDLASIRTGFETHGISLFSSNTHNNIILDAPPFPSRMVDDHPGLEDVNFLGRVFIDSDFAKVIYENGCFKYLFNLGDDPNELHNLIDSENRSVYEHKLTNKYRDLGIFDISQYEHNDVVNLPPIKVINPKFSRQEIVYI